MELGEWVRGWVIESLDNRGSDNKGSTVHDTGTTKDRLTG